MPWLRRLVAGLSPPRTSFDSRTLRIVFVVNKVEVGQTFLQTYRFSLSVSLRSWSIIIIHSSITEAVQSSQIISALNKTLLSLSLSLSLCISISSSKKIHSRNLLSVGFTYIFKVHVWLWETMKYEKRKTFLRIAIHGNYQSNFRNSLIQKSIFLCQYFFKHN